MPRATLALTLGLVLLVGVVGFVQARQNDYDFHHFYRDAAYVWRHGALNPDLDGPDPLARRQLPFYLPAVPLLLAPLTAGGLLPAAAIWTVLQVLAVAVCARQLVAWARAAEDAAGDDATGDDAAQVSIEDATRTRGEDAAPPPDDRAGRSPGERARQTPDERARQASDERARQASDKRARQASDEGVRRADAAVVIAGLLALPAVYESARFNQLGFFVLALVLVGARLTLTPGGGAARSTGRVALGSLAFAAAIALKLLPAVVLLWLAVRREWRAGALTLAAAAGLALVPCLLAFGPQRTWAYHGQWWDHNVAGAPLRGMTDRSLRHHFIDHRNQSLPAVLARLSDAQHPYRVPWQPLSLSPEIARRAGQAGLLGMALALAWLTRRRRTAGQPTAGQLTARSLTALPLTARSPIAESPAAESPTAGSPAAESPTAGSPTAGLPAGAARAATVFSDLALYALAMLLLSPLLRTYYFVWALPALVVLARAALAPGGSGAAPASGGANPPAATADVSAAAANAPAAADRRRRLAGVGGLAVWLIGMIAWPSEVARLYGVHLVMLGLIAAAVVLACPRRGRYA